MSNILKAPSDKPAPPKEIEITPIVNIHQLKMENAEPPSIHSQNLEVQITPESHPEHARSLPVPKNTEYVAYQDGDDWCLLKTDGHNFYHLTENEAKQVAQIINEQGSNVVTLFCRNDKCVSKGSWIKRASGDVKKNVYHCATCSTPMLR